MVVEKIFAEGKGFPNQFGGTSYIVGVKYLDEEVSFFLDEKPHEIYKECGGIGDSVKITSTLTENPVTKGTFYKKLSFDLL
ncbi:MAG: hypothetical protein B6V02_03270 [Thermoprotei archaeon ex4572_64]|nr:MAG: hypothetical protein B6V02_03270 [Thermoprotei archaeon ex4572_64]